MGQNPFQNYIVKFPPGERIFNEGDIGTTMFVVQSGTVRLFREEGGRVKTLGTMEKGDFFGEMSVLEGLPRTNSAESLEECELIEINSLTFDRMIRGNIEIAVRMLRKLSIRLREAEKTIDGLQREVSAPPRATFSSPPLPMPQFRPTIAAGPPTAASGPSSVEPGPSKPSTALPVTAPAPPASQPSRPTAVAARSAAAVPQTAPAPPPPAPAKGSAPPSSIARGQLKGPRLVNDGGDLLFPLSDSESLIGRYDPVTETQPEVDLTPLDIKRSVSRRHARITVSNGNFFIVEEVGALNGTFLNGTRLVTGRPVVLKDGDRLGLGTVELVFYL